MPCIFKYKKLKFIDLFVSARCGRICQIAYREKLKNGVRTIAVHLNVDRFTKWRVGVVCQMNQPKYIEESVLYTCKTRIRLQNWIRG